MEKLFPINAHVLVDGRDDAWVKAVWPEGNTSALYPHYVLVFERSPFAVRRARACIREPGGCRKGRLKPPPSYLVLLLL
jgi:hypothetical protein